MGLCKTVAVAVSQKINIKWIEKKITTITTTWVGIFKRAIAEIGLKRSLFVVVAIFPGLQKEIIWNHHSNEYVSLLEIAKWKEYLKLQWIIS